MTDGRRPPRPAPACRDPSAPRRPGWPPTGSGRLRASATSEIDSPSRRPRLLSSPWVKGRRWKRPVADTRAFADEPGAAAGLVGERGQHRDHVDAARDAGLCRRSRATRSARPCGPGRSPPRPRRRGCRRAATPAPRARRRSSRSSARRRAARRATRPRAALISAHDCQVILVIGSGVSWSQGRFAPLPSPSSGEGTGSSTKSPSPSSCGSRHSMRATLAASAGASTQAPSPKHAAARERRAPVAAGPGRLDDAAEAAGRELRRRAARRARARRRAGVSPNAWVSKSGRIVGCTSERTPGRGAASPHDSSAVWSGQHEVRALAGLVGHRRERHHQLDLRRAPRRSPASGGSE